MDASEPAEVAADADASADPEKYEVEIVLGEGGDTQRLVRELERMAKTSLFTETGLARARERRADKEDEAAE